MLTELALLAFQLSMAEVPLVTAPGVALNLIVGTCWLPEFFCVAIDPPPHPTAAMETVNKKTDAVMREKCIGLL